MDAGFTSEDYLGTTYLDLRGRLLFPGAHSVPAPYRRFGVCPPGYNYPTVSGVTVTAPSGAVLDATWHLSHGNVAVDFETVEAGEHKALVTYEPDPATGRPPTTLTTTVGVSRDRSDAARLSIPFHCTELLRTELGTWICDEQVIRGETVVERLDAGTRYEVEGSSLWGITQEGEVIRWLDTGAGPLQVVNRLPSGKAFQVTHLVVSGDEALVPRYQGLDRYVVPADGGAPRVADSLSFPGAIDVVRNGSELLVKEYTYGGTGGMSRICAYRLEGDAFFPSTAPCLVTAAIYGSNEGPSDEGLWIPGRGSMDLVRAEDGGIAHVARVPVPMGEYQFHPNSSTLADPGYLFDDRFFYDLPDVGQAYALFPATASGVAALDAFRINGYYVGAKHGLIWTERKTADAGTLTEVIFR